MAPLVRHIALVPLSQEHHQGLMLVLKLKKGIQWGVAPSRMSAYLLHIFETELLPHFQEEESGIFLWLDPNHPLRLRGFQEHRDMYALMVKIRLHPERLSLVEAFIQLLDAHIRFEERMLFMHLQEHYQEKLSSMAQTSEARSACHTDSAWPDHFWLPQTSA